MSELKTIQDAKEPCILSIIQSAVLAKDVDVDKLDRLMQLKERYDANQARKEFFTAFLECQNDIPPIVNQSEVSFNSTSYKFTQLCDMAAIVAPYLKKYKFSYRFETKTDNKDIAVTFILTHVSGHSERTTATGPADKTGSKNELQAMGSTLSYLQRNSLKLGLGLTTGDKDSDGRVASQYSELIDDEQIAELENLITTYSAQRKKFLEFFGIENLRDMPISRLGQATRMLRKKGESS